VYVALTTNKYGQYSDTENSLVFPINLRIFKSSGILKKKTLFGNWDHLSIQVEISGRTY